MANYCKTCGADLPVETKILTWKELCEWVKSLNNKNACVKKFDDKEEWISVGDCFAENLGFYKTGLILGESIIAENRTIEQMKSIIENLL